MPPIGIRIFSAIPFNDGPWRGALARIVGTDRYFSLVFSFPANQNTTTAGEYFTPYTHRRVYWARLSRRYLKKKKILICFFFNFLTFLKILNRKGYCETPSLNGVSKTVVQRKHNRRARTRSVKHNHLKLLTIVLDRNTFHVVLDAQYAHPAHRVLAVFTGFHRSYSLSRSVLFVHDYTLVVASKFLTLNGYYKNIILYCKVSITGYRRIWKKMEDWIPMNRKKPEDWEERGIYIWKSYNSRWYSTQILIL